MQKRFGVNQHCSGFGIFADIHVREADLAASILLRADNTSGRLTGVR